MKSALSINVTGHVVIKDDLGNILLDKYNAIHPQNMARILARGLANEGNHHVFRMAFGRGGTAVDSAANILYQKPNDGMIGVGTYNARLYDETYSEVVDEESVLLGRDIGSSDSGGFRQGGADDGLQDGRNSVTSEELGIQSRVRCRAFLSKNEPKGQYQRDIGITKTDSYYEFDEIGLYSSGSFPSATNGYKSFDIYNKTSSSELPLELGESYDFVVTVDGTNTQVITFTVPPSGTYTYGDLCEAINTSKPQWNINNNSTPTTLGTLAIHGAKMLVTDDGTNMYPTLVDINTNNMLQIRSNSTGITSSIEFGDDDTTPLENRFFYSLNPDPSAFEASFAGQDSGNPETVERLLAHITFDPILKTANREYEIVYDLLISVARSSGQSDD